MLVITLSARSLSASLTTIPPGTTLRVISVHHRVVNCLSDAGHWVALVHPQVQNGPFHIVLTRPASFAAPAPGDAGMWHGRGVEIGSFYVDITSAVLWQPHLAPLPQDRPAALWPALQQHVARRTRIAPAAGLAHATASRLNEGQDLLRYALLTGREDDLVRGVAMLAGLGPGLTPAGDDFLLGLMARLHLAPPAGRDFSGIMQIILAEAGPRTTRLSREWLCQAALGHFAEPWHHLRQALAAGTAADVRRAADAILAIGATSGQQAMIGFLGIDDEMLSSLKKGHFIAKAGRLQRK